MSELQGSSLLAHSLADQGVRHLFGVVGFPVTELARAAQRERIEYIGFRNEQSASYAAGALGYLTGRLGVCLTVSGPGMVHAIAGLANAWANCWPLVLLGGAPDAYQDGQGSFQEAPQLEAARPFVKAARRVDRTERIPYYVEQALRTACYGRPGAVYLDLPHDVLAGRAAQAHGRGLRCWAARARHPHRRRVRRFVRSQRSRWRRALGARAARVLDPAACGGSSTRAACGAPASAAIRSRSTRRARNPDARPPGGRAAGFEAGYAA